MTQQKTYWHLGDRMRRPSNYEIVSSELLYYLRLGFEVNVPASAWYEKYQRQSPLVCNRWEAFTDPRQTTYARYTELQATRETYVDGLLEAMEDRGYAAQLGREWIASLERVFAPLLYPVHGLQMIAAYVGQLAPGSRLTIAALFQVADEIRRVQRIAYRVRQLAATQPGFGNGMKAAWQEDPIWQPLRETIEQLLVTYDWGESLVALNLAVKPLFDELFTTQLARLAVAAGDTLLAELLRSLAADCEWQRSCAAAVVETALAEREQNRDVIHRWLGVWRPRALRAVRAFLPAFEAAYRETGATALDVPLEERLQESLARYLAPLGLDARAGATA